MGIEKLSGTDEFLFQNFITLLRVTKDAEVGLIFKF
jgi:hypothetical protein